MPRNRRPPSERKPERTWMSEAPRRTAWKVSSRVSTRRTGRPARRAMKATSGSYFAGCFPPDPPPRAGAESRTLARGGVGPAGAVGPRQPIAGRECRILDERRHRVEGPGDREDGGQLFVFDPDEPGGLLRGVLRLGGGGPPVLPA